MATVQFGADHERLDRQIRTIDPDPYPPWCNLRFVGIEPLELADHLTVARRWGKDVKAFCSRRRFRWTDGALRTTSGEGEAGSSLYRRPASTGFGFTGRSRTKASKATSSTPPRLQRRAGAGGQRPTRSMVKRWFEHCSPTSAAYLGSVQWSRCPLPTRKTAATSAASAKRQPPRECDTSIVSKDFYSARAYPDISRCAATGASGWKNSKPATAAPSLSILKRSSTVSSIGLNFFSNRSRPWRPRGTRCWLWSKRPSRRRQRCYLS